MNYHNPYYYFLYGKGCSYSDHTTLTNKDDINTKDKKYSNQNCFDKFGNYVFHTDLKAETPNIAIGTPSSLSFLNGICLNDYVR